MEQVLDKHPQTLEEWEFVTIEKEYLALEQGVVNGIKIISSDIHQQNNLLITGLAEILLTT